MGAITPVALRPWGGSEVGEENLTQRRKAAKNANGTVSKSNGEIEIRLPNDAPGSRQNGSGPGISSSVAPSPLRVRSSSSKDIAPASDLGERAKVSLTMIVREEENNLPRCLESVRGIFDEIIVVDTGSTDRTVEIARSFGAKVFDFVWVDSFSAARNEALAHATGDFAFWLDADLSPRSPVRGSSPARGGRLCRRLGRTTLLRMHRWP